jgi:hypothetical protein
MKRNSIFISIIFTIILLFNILIVFGTSEPNINPYNNNIILITNSKTYEQYGFEDLGIYYNEQGLTEFNMPFIIKRSSIDISTSNELSGSVDVETSNFKNRIRNYDYEILATNKQYSIINYKCNIIASTKVFSVDFIPEIKGIKYSEFAWFNSSWFMNKMFTINHSMIDSNLENFPVLVKIPVEIGAYCDNGNSIRFVDMTNTTEYAYEIDVWNNSGNSFVWVCLPNVYSSIDTNFMMYYNNSNAVDDEAPNDVWDSNYVGVWHMNVDNATHTFDSTSNNHHGELNLYTVNYSAYVGYGLDFNGSGDCIIDLGTDSDFYGLDDLTAMASFELSDLSAGFHSIFGFSGGPNDRNWEFGFNDNDMHFRITNGSSAKYEYVDGVTIEHTVGFGWNDNQNLVGASHNEKSETTSSTLDLINTAKKLGLGGFGDLTYYGIYGMLDEVRISNVVRSDAWRNAVYQNLVDYDNFMSASNVHFYESGNTSLEGNLNINISLDDKTIILIIWIILILSLLKISRNYIGIAIAIGFIQLGFISLMYIQGYYIEIIPYWFFAGIVFLFLSIYKYWKGVL